MFFSVLVLPRIYEPQSFQGQIFQAEDNARSEAPSVVGLEVPGEMKFRPTLPGLFVYQALNEPNFSRRRFS
jgi:hypothetical protein